MVMRFSLEGLGELMLMQDDYTQAQKLFEEALRLCETACRPSFRSGLYSGLGFLESNLDHNKRSRSYFNNGSFPGRGIRFSL